MLEGLGTETSNQGTQECFKLPLLLKKVYYGNEP